MQTKLARFTKESRVVTQKAVIGASSPADSNGESGYAAWVIVSKNTPESTSTNRIGG